MTTDFARFGALSTWPVRPGHHSPHVGPAGQPAGAATGDLPAQAGHLRLAAGALDVERWGLRMRLHPLDNGCEKNLLFTPQMYEPEELAALRAEIDRTKAARRSFVFVDIGANVGLFSLFVAAKAGPAARILAIEPEPGNFARLAFNIASNPPLPIEPVAVALGDQVGEVAIALNRRDRGGTRVQAFGSADTVNVPLKPLMNLLREKDISAIDALKIDVRAWRTPCSPHSSAMRPIRSCRA